MGSLKASSRLNAWCLLPGLPDSLPHLFVIPMSVSYGPIETSDYVVVIV